MATSLVGRLHEKEEFGRRLVDLAPGSGAVMLLAGEAGIGKSRTLAEFTATAQARGVITLLCRSIVTQSCQMMVKQFGR